ncbi:MAG: replication/maintenance protein RepL [Cytophagaceae bacterium]|nr:replication/maintenance protein RepL [Cytophagaceae bacterium]
METEKQLLQDGVAMLTKLAPIDRIEIEPKTQIGKQYDAVIHLLLGGVTVDLTVEVKRSAQRLVWGQLLEQLKNTDNPTLLTDYVNPILGEKLRHQGINYVDTAGNAYLSLKSAGLPFLVWIEGRKPIKRNEEKADHAFTKSGLRVSYWLLTHPDQINQTIRTMAQETGVSLETVHRAKISLQQRGFLVEVRQGEWKLINRKILLDKWIEAYATRLQPGLLQGRYRLLKAESTADWAKQTIETPLTQWGGEPAADGYTDFLRPMEWIVYTRQSTQEVMKQLRLLPDPQNGQIRLYKKFWPQDEPGKFVHPLLVYTDLLISRDSRNAEVAQKLYKTHVQRLLD